MHSFVERNLTMQGQKQLLISGNNNSLKNARIYTILSSQAYGDTFVTVINNDMAFNSCFQFCFCLYDFQRLPYFYSFATTTAD